MPVSFRVSLQCQPRLGPGETPYQLYCWIGGVPGFVQTRRLCLMDNSPPLLSFELPDRVPFDAALMVEFHVNSVSPDEFKQPGVMVAGTSLIPLRECLRTDKAGAQYKTPITYQNIVDSNPGYKGHKGDLTATFDRATFPGDRDPFKKPNALTVDHFREQENPVVGATIEASLAFCSTTPSRFDTKCVLPPYRFHDFLLPGQMLAAKQTYAPQSEEWWESLVEMGMRRARPQIPIDQVAASLKTEMDWIECFANAITAPANYWTYFPDSTVDRKRGLLMGEAFCLTTRAKCGVVTVGGKTMFRVPGQDCEDDEEDIQKLWRSFGPSVQVFKNPFLAKLQDYVGNWVFMQSLCGVNGAQLSDGKAAGADPYANMGYHECGVVMRKATFMKMLGRVNTARPLIPGWAEEHNPDAPFSPIEDQPMVLEGTGAVDPRGNGYRNTLLGAYRYLMMGNAQNHFLNWKLVQWQDRRQVNDFYRVFLQFVVPELYDRGYANASFVAMSQEANGGNWKRVFTYQELMQPGMKPIGLRMEMGFTQAQAETLKKVASFYPPVEPYTDPAPVETCPLRSELARKMARITTTMAECKRSVRAGASVAVADFYPAYHHIDDKRVTSICDMIRAKSRIVDVTVAEEPVTTGLGGFAVAFHVDLTPDEHSRLAEVVGARKLKHLPFMHMKQHVDKAIEIKQ